uniref:Dynamin-1-like protein n=2 Tax=Aceria tosichella TaxID=561515 RepID=A0A6G1S368_9ACAR
MESLIPIVNQLQDICNAVTIPLPLDLPQIVVVGTQSSGKSSVIESIVKREFLPRGQGIVTRRPLVIRLFKVTERDSDEAQAANNININGTAQISGSGDWVKFTHSDKIFTDFDEVREEIERETDRVCGTNKGICAEPITLGVYSKNVVNLTLVDLPGLTKNPVGSQPEDIEIQIRELVTKYIRNPNSIILAVTAANTDFATSEAIKLAREVDPDGKRTLAVLTKLDIMDPGTDALEVLTGRLIMIRLGIIGVVNRSQKDITEKKSIEKAIEDEANFLQRRYPTIADKNGQPYLSKRLSQLLMRHIRDCLPDLKIRVNSLISQYQAQLNSYGEPVTDKAKTIIDVITKFSLSYCDTIKGGKRQIKTTELCGGARIQYIFHDSFGRALSAINPLETLDNKAILTAARNAAGVRTAICVPDVFELLVTSQIKRLEDPSLRCVELVHEEMGRFVKHCGDEVHLELLRFPKLREKIEEILTKLLNERLPVTREAIVNLVGYGSAFIDTEHPRLRESFMVTYCDPIKPAGDTVRSASSLGQQNGKSNPGGPIAGTGDDASLRHERELRECEAIARKIHAYFNIVRDEIKVFVPRAIMHCMVNHIKSNLQSALIKEVYHYDMFDMLLSESDDIAKRRNETAEMLNALKKASEIINAIHYQKHQL